MATTSYKRDNALQEFANEDPEQADLAMDALGYTNSPNRPIAATSLQPTAPFKLQPAKPASGTDGALAFLQAKGESYANQLQTDADAQRKKVTSVGDEFAGTLEAPGKTALTADAYERKGVNAAEAELKDINNELLAEQRALQSQVREIEKNPQGMTRQALNDEIQRVKSDSLARQADLSIIQMARQGKFDSAKAIADRAVAALVEEKTSKLEALKFMYQENKDLFTTAEQRAFESKSKSMEDEIAFERDKLMKEYDFQIYKERANYDQRIKESDPLYQAQLAKAQRDLIDAGTTGNYDVSTLANPTLSTSENNQGVLTSIFKNSKVSPANRTTIGNGLALLKAAQDLAEENPNGKFPGLYPLRDRWGLKLLVPDAFKREKTVQNESLISALDLQTQFWASGAALSDEQTKLVLKMIPTAKDTDKQVRTKVNQLINYMLSQTASRLMTDGVTFTPEKVDLFETPDLLQQASPEQLAELRASGLIQ